MEPPKDGDSVEEMRHSPPAHALQHHLPRSPRTPPRAPRRRCSQSAARTASSHEGKRGGSSPSSWGAMTMRTTILRQGVPHPVAVRACMCTAAAAVRVPRVPTPRSSTPSSSCPRFEQCHQVREAPSPALARCRRPKPLTAPTPQGCGPAPVATPRDATHSGLEPRSTSLKF